MSIQNIISLINRLIGWDEAKDVLAKIQAILIAFMQLGFLGAFIIASVEQMWFVLFVSVAAIISIWLPLFFAKRGRVHVPVEFQFLLTLFIYGTLFLGEITGFYTRFWWWDVVLHTGSGIALGFVGFLVMYTLYKNGRIEVNPGLFALFSFMFALSLGALWEIFEFAGDGILGTKMQKNGLHDTMWDLIVDTVGAFLAAISGYFYVKHETRGVGIFRYYMEVYMDKNKY